MIRWVLLALALVTGAVAVYSMRSPDPAATDFTDDLRGPASPQLHIPFEAYSLTPQGLLRSKSVTGTEFGNDRPMVRTVSGDYLSRDFVFEIDVTIPAGTQDLAYVGFGRGQANSGYYNEPAASFLFRIHNGVGGNAIHVAASRPPSEQQTGSVYAAFEELGTYAPGAPTTFRIEREQHRVTLSVLGAGPASKAFDMSVLPRLFDEGEAFLFFGNSTEGTVFANMRVRPRG